MSSDSEFTAYRRDARSSFVFDMDDQIKTLTSLMEKANEEYDAAVRHAQQLRASLRGAENRANTLLIRVTSWKTVLEVVTAKFNEGDDETEEP